RSVADVERSLIAIEIQTIKGCIARNPLGNFEHTLIRDEKIDRCTKALADWLPAAIQFVTRVLIEFRGNAARDVLGKLPRAESVRQDNVTEVVDDWVKHERRQMRERIIRLGLLGDVRNTRLRLRFPTDNEVAKSEMRATALLEARERSGRFQLKT